ncbi:MAG: hypothetical protein JWO11_254 [Nocardioides sp.]|nr:hypothetical protein [Nocardioides sp.]
MTDASLQRRVWARLRRSGRRLTAPSRAGRPRSDSSISAATGGSRLRGRAAELVGRPGGRAVVILADPASQVAVRGWLRDLSGDEVTLLLVGGLPGPGDRSEADAQAASEVAVGGLADVVACLARRNAQDVIVVVLGSAVLGSLGADHAGLMEHLFLHLRPGGAYLVDRTVEDARARRDRDANAQDLIHRMLAVAQGGGEDVAGLSRRQVAVAGCAKDVLVTEDLMVATKRGPTLLMVREHQVEDLLPAREPGIEVSVLERRPEGHLNLQLADVSYGPSRADPWPARLEYPELTLRHYEGDLLSVGKMRLTTGNTILPESFRWPHAKVLSHPRIASVTPTFARPDPLTRRDRRTPARVLDGDYYFLDCVFSGHFGHLTTEVLSRLWGWERAKRDIPGLKALFHTNPARGRDGALERRLLTAFGIRESDLVWSDRPVRLRGVVGASPMWHNEKPYYAHPDIRDTWARMTAGLLAGADPAEHERIFVSRGAALSSRRGCRNQQEVEQVFADRGFHVFYPEELPLSEQVALFAGARVVAGFGGSGMFNLMHTRRLEAVVVISQNAYVARNEYLFTSVLGGQLHYFWEQSDVEPPAVGRSKASDRASFAFDFATQGADLQRVLASL